MRKDAAIVEESRLQGIEKIEDYPSFHERHRIFPEIFEDRKHENILDIAAGVGCAARRIHDLYSDSIICNDITKTCLHVLHQQCLTTVSFDIDDRAVSFPFENDTFDAVVSLATIEHVINLDEHLKDVHRILKKGGYLYISSPNYASLVHFTRYILKGESFHDPLNEQSRYEFYAHVRYFTYKTLLNFVRSFGFMPVSVYLPLPEGSSFYKHLRARSALKAWIFRSSMWMLYKFGSPRWASEPVLVFQKSEKGSAASIRKVVI